MRQLLLLPPAYSKEKNIFQEINNKQRITLHVLFKQANTIDKRGDVVVAASFLLRLSSYQQHRQQRQKQQQQIRLSHSVLLNRCFHK